MHSEIFVVGAGSWGVALSHAVGVSGRHVRLCGRNTTVVEQINQTRLNPHYPDSATVDEKVTAQIGYGDIERCDTLLMVVPAQATRHAILDIGAERLRGKNIILCAKGLERASLKRQSEIVAELVHGAKSFSLSGPSFAIDVARSKPTAVTLAGTDLYQANRMVDLLAGPTFRPYASDDLAGVELAGALKNVYALGAGAVDGAGLGFSARSSFIARGFVEMGRLVEALGGSRPAISGLAGLGDLTMSCTTRESRNYDFGYRLGGGKRVEEILNGDARLVEGLFSAPVCLKLAQDCQVDVPIAAAVNALLDGEATVERLVKNLMARPLGSE